MTGDRRWAPGRKLIVLGKFPKPINLPSQRLENHGLDRDVEIVPKGTLTWGSRPAAASPNAWGASSLSSPNTDGSSGSPVIGRPSSAGTGGLRPSTAGSDFSHDSASSAGGANSRPSSASGTLASSQTSFTANRPRSAETRPGSSHLSRFAENLSEHTSAWGQPRSGERMAPPPSRTSGFTLSSGDFPTLGTEKISRSHISEDHVSQGRPKSSGFAKTEVPERLSGMTEVEANMAPGDLNAWNDGSQPSHGVRTLPYKENSQTDIQKALPCHGIIMPSHQFNSWHGQPVCSPDGVLHGGGPVSGTFRPLARPPGPPGCHSAEAFGYYSQGPAQFANSHPVAIVGQMPSGYYAQGGDMFRPIQQSDSFMVSDVSVPTRPGSYQGPATYDAYCCPRPSIYGFTDSESPGKGTTSPSGVHADPGKLSASPGLHTSVVAKELVRSDQVDATCQGKYKVLLKHHDVSEDGCPRGRKQQEVSTDKQKFVVGDQHEAGAQVMGWETETEKDGRSSSIKSLPREGSSQHSCNWKDKLPGSGGSTSFSTSRKTADEGIMKQPETASSPTQQVYLITKKNAALFEKIDGLNNEAQMADEQGENENFISQEKSGRSKVVNKAEGYLPIVSPGDALNVRPASVALGRSQASDTVTLIEEKSRDGPDGHALNPVSESGILTYNKIDPQRSRNNHSQRFNRLEGEGKHASSRSFPVVGPNSEGDSSRACVITDPHSSTARKEFHYTSNSSGTGQFAAPSMDSSDRKAQRAKFKERAAQRGERLRQEEEERVREQKARALAKLEELDRRSATPQLNLDSNGDPSASSDFQLKEDLETCALKTDAISDRVHNSAETSECFETRDHVEAKRPGDGSCSASSAGDGSTLSHDKALPLNNVDGGTVENVIQGHFIHGGSFGNPEQMVHERQIIGLEEKLVEHPINCEDMGDPKNSDAESVHNVPIDKLLPAKERSIQNKRKNSKNSRSKSKVNHGTAPGRNLLSERTVSEASQGMEPNDKGSPPPQLVDLVPHAAPQTHQEAIDGKISSSDGDASSMKRSSIASAEQHARFGNQWKPQSSKRPEKSQQTQRHGDKFQGSEAVVWAPVKPRCQNNPSEEIMQNDSTQTGNSDSGNNGQTQNAGTKVKRAEIERYVPKDAPKEIPRPENSLQPLSTMTQASLCDATGEPDFMNSRNENPVVMPESIAESATEVRSWDNNKSNRHGRMRPSWRQRNPSGSVQALQGSGEVEATSEFANPVELPSDQSREMKPKPSEQLEQGGMKDNVANPTISELGTVSSHKDQGVASKHRHHRHKGQRDSVASGAHLAPEDSQGGFGNTNGTGHPASEVNDLGRRQVSGVDNTSAGNRENRRAHWQPKSQSHAFESRAGSRSGGTRRAAPESVKSEHDFSMRSSEDFANEYLDSNPSTQGVHSSDIRNASNQEANRGRNDPVGVANKRTLSMSESIEVESSPAGAGPYHRQQYGPSTMRRHGQHSVWVDKRQESTYGDRDVGQEIGKPNIRSGGGGRGSGERKSGPVLEYQPIGPSNNYNPSNADALGGDAHAAGPRYREQRVQNHRRRS